MYNAPTDSRGARGDIPKQSFDFRTGFSFLEKPQLVTGDDTILQPGMVLAVDGSVAVETFRAQVGDSFIITEDGYEAVTDHPKALDAVII